MNEKMNEGRNLCTDEDNEWRNEPVLMDRWMD